jgi:hypothetical protein
MRISIWENFRIYGGSVSVFARIKNFTVGEDSAKCGASFQQTRTNLCSTSETLKLAYIYFEDELRQRSAAKLLTKDEAQRIACDDIARKTSGPNIGSAHLAASKSRYEAHMPFDFDFLVFLFAMMLVLRV